VRANWLLKLSFEQSLIITKEGPQRHIESVIGGANQISQRPVPISAFIVRARREALGVPVGSRDRQLCACPFLTVTNGGYGAVKKGGISKSLES
jgi:hypothetical protein